MAGSLTKLIDGATATGAGTAKHMPATGRVTFQASGTTSAGAGAATIKVQVSNDNSNWLDLATISLTLSTTADTAGTAVDANWGYVRGNVTALSGTDAAVTLVMGS